MTPDDQAHEEAFMHDAVASVLPALRELPEALDLLRELAELRHAGPIRVARLAEQAHKLLVRISPLRAERITFTNQWPKPTGKR